MKITVSVVEDNKSFRASLVELIRSTDGFKLVSEYSNAEEAIDIIRKNPDIVIIDIVLPGKSGIELITEIKEKQERIQFLVCSSYDDDDRIFAALEAGASGYIMKDYNSAEIVHAIRELYYGGSPMSPYIARRVINSFQKKKIEEDHELTDREKEILEFVSTGMMYKEIADKLFITHDTVKTHMRNIYHKLHVQNRVEAINKLKNNK
jgi:DNA-binding NarL/FixJ family response regulator